MAADQSIKWWVTRAGGTPIGPADPELIVRGIDTGAVPLDSLVCPVGGATWVGLREEPAFAHAVDERRRRRAASGERDTVLDLGPLAPSEPPPDDLPLERFDDAPEHTIAEPRPLTPSEAPTIQRVLPLDEEERTVVADPDFTRDRR
jgi:hypothetical protein